MRDGVPAGVVEAVAWHDLECGAYAEDLPLWHELAADPDRPPGPILDVGAGTGRVALDLARAGHEVIALDADAELLAALRERGRGLPVSTLLADARDFALDRRCSQVIVPMQSVQLLGGGHGAFLRCAARALAPGGLVAMAIADPPPYDGDVRPLPDMTERDGWIWCSRPVAIRERPDGMAIERVRELVSPTGERTVSEDVVVLARLTAAELERAGAEAGLRPAGRRAIAQTDDYVGSEVVVLRG
ncbi:MAG TPA: class I SAM-dependent methyltransferase [Solirubrobacteraceae bacterium]|nr:class I SAM-dependent methyltransferase [Solirubrobacteraceae bacterium]